MALRKSELIELYEFLSKDFHPDFLSRIFRPTGRNGKYVNRDYISANAVLSELHKSKLPPTNYKDLRRREDIVSWLHPTTVFRLNMYTPCLACRIDELPAEDQAALFTKPHYIFTEKLNGVRGILVHIDGVTKLYARNYGDDGGLIDYWGNVYQTCKCDYNFAIDVEIMYNNTEVIGEPLKPFTEFLEEHGIYVNSNLEAVSTLLNMDSKLSIEIQKAYKEYSGGLDLFSFHVITPLMYRNENYMNRPLKDAYLLSSKMIAEFEGSGINVYSIRKVRGSKEEKEVFLHRILDVEHGEGVVVHNLLSTYKTSDVRDRDTFIKIKRKPSDAASKVGLGDSIDAWVTGYRFGVPGTPDEGKVSVLEFSTSVVLNSGKMIDHVIAYVTYLPKELKEELTLCNEDGVPYFNPEYYDKVGAISGESISYRNKRLINPRIIAFPREDKNKVDCVYTEQWLNGQTDFNN